MNPNKRYNLGIDVIKSCAVFFVIGYHFLLHTSKPDLTYSSISIFCYSLVRQMFIICVPLFLLATGYLMEKKKIEKSYFKKITSVLVTYLVVSLVTGGIRAILLKDILNVQDFIFRLINFNLNGYAWYVSMYIGLYLFIPFINILLDQLDKKKFKLLISIFLLVCALAEFVNSFPLVNEWVRLPSYWISIYPMMYYVLGVYLKRYPIVDKKKAIALTLIPFIFAVIVHNYYSEESFSDHVGYYASIINVMQATGFFSFVQLLDFSKIRGPGRSVLRKTSSMTLEIYLYSYIVDWVLYPNWLRILGQGKELIIFAPVIMIVHFIISFIMASLTQFLIQKVKKSWVNRKEKLNPQPQ